MMWYLAMVAVLAVSACLLYYLLPAYKHIQAMRKVVRGVSHIPCPIEKFHWLLGNLPYHPGPTEEGLTMSVKFTEKFPYYFTVFFNRYFPTVAAVHPDIVRQLVKTSAPKPLVPGGVYTFMFEWIGDGLLLSKGQKWFRNRRLLTPGFHFDILKPYVKVFNQCTDTLIDNLSKANKSVDIYNIISYCTLEIILKCAFSYDKEVQTLEQADSPYVAAVMCMTERLVKRLFNPLHYVDFVYYRTKEGREFKNAVELSHRVAMDVIRKRRKTLAELGEEQMRQTKKYVDFLDILLLAKDEDGKGLTDQEIQDEVETFMFEGHDTTKSAIAFSLYNIARHPEIFKAAQKEIDVLLEGRDSDEILWDDLSKMPYLTKCIKESMRIHPPVPFIGRVLDKPCTVEGRVLPEHTIFDIYIYTVHHNPLVWGPDHMTFDPERFSDENMSKMDPYAYIPFSAGNRNCIGQNFAMNELKVTVARCIRKFNISVDPEVKVELLPEVIMKTKNGIYLNFEPRKQAR